LEKQLAEVSQNESTRIRDLQNECERLRNGLLAARRRIRGFTTALDGVSDNIGTVLGFNSESIPDETGTAEHLDLAEDPEPELADSGSLSTSTDKSDMPPHTHHTHHPQNVNSSEPMQLDATNKTWQSTMAPDTPLEPVFDRSMQIYYGHCETGAPNTGLDSYTWRLHSGDASMHSRGPANPVQYNHDPEIETLNTQVGLEGMDVRKTPGLDNPNLLLGSGHHEPNILSTLQIFPPGSIIFPSSSSAHLAACEFFIKQNKVYKQRHQPGGTEALVAHLLFKIELTF
jgi:hypothetical protein